MIRFSDSDLTHLLECNEAGDLGSTPDENDVEALITELRALRGLEAAVRGYVSGEFTRLHLADVLRGIPGEADLVPGVDDDT